MKVAFCGDMMLKTPSRHTLGPKLRGILNGCDIRVINFEVPIETADAVGIHKSGPVHNQSPLSSGWIKDKGFNVVTLANNHSLDYGEEGLRNTINSLKGITITGVGTYDTAYNLSIIDKGDEKIGFLGLTHKEWGCVDMFSGESLGTACLTSPKALKSIVDSKDKVDRLYVLPHAGVEYLEMPLPELRELYRTFIDLGASGVIGSHPHVPQGVEIYKNCPIVYSLGNFLFEIPNLDQKPKNFLTSLLAVIDISSNTPEIYTLYYDYKKCEVEIIEDKDVQKYLNYLNELLKEDIYRTKILNELASLAPQYKNHMIIGGAYRDTFKNRFKNFLRPLFGKKRFYPDKVHLLNLFQCESHRWTMTRLLNDLKK